MEVRPVRPVQQGSNDNNDNTSNNEVDRLRVGVKLLLVLYALIMPSYKLLDSVKIRYNPLEVCNKRKVIRNSL